jgi:hypothetical protein
MTLPQDQFVALARTVNESYSELEAQADKLLEQYSTDYSKAGLVERWGDVADSGDLMFWRPDAGQDGLYFTGFDRGGDGLYVTVPFEYILDPQGWIARAKDAREHERLRKAKDELLSLKTAQQTEIARLKARLVELEGEQA